MTGVIPVKQSEKAALVDALQQADGNQTLAADILGVSRVTVWKRMKKHGITLKKGKIDFITAGIMFAFCCLFVNGALSHHI